VVLPHRKEKALRFSPIRFRVAVVTSVLVIGVGTVGAGLTAASAGTVAHVPDKATKAEQSLGNHVPYADTCVGATASVKALYATNYPEVKKQTKSIVAAIKCTPMGAPVPEVVIFTQWKNAADMKSYYFASVVGFNLTPNQGAAGQTTCPQEGSLSIKGKHSGRYDCSPADPKHPADFFWTRESLKIMGEALLTNDTNGSALYAWFFNGNPGPTS
jgi:hypothetical protein